MAVQVLLDRSRHRAKVVDFGISKLCEQEQLSSSDPRDATCSTGQGASHSKACHTAEVGTARYAAPEVFAILPATTGQGAGGEVQGAVSSSASGVVGFANSSRAEYSERCDVYSFGLMLWEMCHIRIVFEGNAESKLSHHPLAAVLTHSHPAQSILIPPLPPALPRRGSAGRAKAGGHGRPSRDSATSGASRAS